MRIIGITCALILAAVSLCVAAAPPKIVLVAGKPSHGPGLHEHMAGFRLLEKWLTDNKAAPVVVSGGWPADESVFDGASAVVLFMDGGKKHELLVGNRMETMQKLAARGTGIAMLHYALEIPQERGGPQFIEWIGGFYDRPYSQNPKNELDVKQASPSHPISRGWKSFRAPDEWYHHIRFAPGDGRVTPILTAVIPGPDAEPQILAWATQRKDGGRGFGFTGLHPHQNWAIPAFRQLLVNAVLWTAKADIPSRGAKCQLAPDDLKKNLDDKPRKK